MAPPKTKTWNDEVDKKTKKPRHPRDSYSVFPPFQGDCRAAPASLGRGRRLMKKTLE
jgi:hypothetical protein